MDGAPLPTVIQKRPAPNSISVAGRSGDSFYIPEIDGLRAVAVVSVILYHLNAALMPGGFTGVDLFFVISGYVVSASLGRDAGQPFATMLRRFYARRILRIVPALLACLLVTTALTVLLIPNSWLSDTSPRTGLYAFFGISNFALLSSDSYFSPRPESNPFTQTWSLAVEEQFYLFFPIVFFFWSRLGYRKDLIGAAANYLLAALVFFSFVFLWWISRINQEAAFYLLPSRFWELGAGALLFQAQCGLQGRRSGPLNVAFRVMGAQSVLALGAALVLMAAVFADRQADPFPWAVPAVIGGLLIIQAVSTGQTSRSPVGWLLRSRGMIFVGKISYPLYLWHWPVYVLFRWTVGLKEPACLALAVGLSFMLAYLSYTLLERPIRRGRWIRAQRKSLIIVVGLISIVISWKTARLAFEHQYRLSLSVVTQGDATWYPDAWPNERRWRSAADGCALKINHESIDGAYIEVARRGCGGPPLRRLFVVGDSHAGAYSAMLWHLALEQDIEVHKYSHAGCGFASLLRPALPNCEAFVRASAKDIGEKAAAGDIVFLASLRMNRLSDQSGMVPATIAALIADQSSNAQAADRLLAHQEALSLIGAFIQRGLRVVIDAPKPVFKAPPFRCSDWFNAGNPVCQAGLAVGREDLLEYRKPVMDSIAGLSSAYPALVTWDPFPVLCPQDPCRAVTESGPLFFDGDHLSGLGDQLLYPDFARVMAKVWASGAGQVSNRPAAPPEH
jgi:peptidoglycan/LPS O-acetylase OafA/YrhL